MRCGKVQANEIHWFYGAISAIFCSNFKMLGLKKHVLSLRNWMVLLSYILRHLFIHFYAIKMEFTCNIYTIWAILAIFVPILIIGYPKAYTWAEKTNGQCGRVCESISIKFSSWSTCFLVPTLLKLAKKWLKWLKLCKNCV